VKITITIIIIIIIIIIIVIINFNSVSNASGGLAQIVDTFQVRTGNWKC